MEIVAQHDALTLARSSGVLALIDGALPASARTNVDNYERAWTELSRLRDEQKQVGGDRRALERQLDAIRLQAEEISEATLLADEDIELATRADRLRNAEGLTQGLTAAHGALADDGGAIDRLGNTIAELRRLVALDPSLDHLHQQAVAASDALGELMAEIAGIAAGLEHDPTALELVEARIHLINDLRRKYGETVTDVIAFGERAETEAATLQRRLAAAATLDEDITKAQLLVVEQAAALSKARAATAKRLAKAAAGHLRDLGMKDPLVSFDLEGVAPGQRGADRAILTFASDKSLPAGAVSRIASGGELSRLVLSLRLAAGVADAAVVAFDEIDAGVGGSTALAMGEKLARLGVGRQVLCVSHLPQIAAFADTHVVVDREGSRAVARVVDGPERLREITRMLSGLDETDTGLDHAQELLEVARARIAAGG
jgi:DNA repair protein RecN (Recombination protein N)